MLCSYWLVYSANLHGWPVLPSHPTGFSGLGCRSRVHGASHRPYARIPYPPAHKLRPYVKPIFLSILKSRAALTQYLPMSLATRKERERFEQSNKVSGIPDAIAKEVDLFSRERESAIELFARSPIVKSQTCKQPSS